MNRRELEFPEDAVWIGSDHPFDLYEAYSCFRSPNDWHLDQLPATAVLFITADSRYRLWVNGKAVARGPGRSYPQTQSVDQLDLTAYLRTGANTIAVQVYQPGYSHFSYLHRGMAGMLAHLTCDGQTSLVSNSTWRTRRDPSFHSLVPRVSIYGSGVEERDLNLADDWTDLDYNDSAWAHARIVAYIGAYPWTALRLRELPLLVERPISLTFLEARRGKGGTAVDRDPHLALRAGWFASASQPDLLPESGWLTAVLETGESAYWLFDLGRDYACQGWAEIVGATGQEQLCISYAETIRNGELIISDPETYCRVRLTDHFHLRSGSQHAETFALRGGRYLLFQVTGPTGPDFRLRPQARISEYPFETTYNLPPIDDRLSAIMAICEDTFAACLQDGFVDSTWRESSQWLGDALPQSLIMASMTSDIRPLRQVIVMASEGAYPDGILPSVLPGEVHSYAVIDYNFMWIELLGIYLQLTDDNALVERVWMTLCKMLDRFHEDLDYSGLLISQPGRRLFLDWAPLSRSEPNAVYTLHYLLALQKAVALAEGCRNRSGDAAIWRNRAAAVQVACRDAFWREGRWYDDQEQTTFSQLAAAFALLTDTVVAEERELLLDQIAVRSLDPDDGPLPDKMVLASPFMHHYIFEALRQGGRSEQVVEIIRLRWGRWVDSGHPTVWENWNIDFPDGSQCHAFSAHPRYHLAQILQEQPSL